MCHQPQLPGPPRNLEQAFQAMWSQHNKAVAAKYHSRIVDSVKSKTQGAIWRCEDQPREDQPRASVCYCPVLYRNMLDGTFCNKNVFHEVTEDFEGELPRFRRQLRAPCNVDTRGLSGASRRHHKRTRFPSARRISKQADRLFRSWMHSCDLCLRPDHVCCKDCAALLSLKHSQKETSTNSRVIYGNSSSREPQNHCGFSTPLPNRSS